MGFDEAWPNRLTIDVGGLAVPVLGKKEFVANKPAVGRPRDLSDLDLLEESDVNP